MAFTLYPIRKLKEKKMFGKRVFSVVSLMVVVTMLLAACGTPAAAPTAAPAAGGKDLTIAGVVFQDDQFMKSMVQGSPTPVRNMASRS
jgi:hypothetical protein